MNLRFLRFLCIGLFSLSLWQCQSKVPSTHTLFKHHPKDPYRINMVESQFFEVDTKLDQVIEGKEGTVIVMPKACFLYPDGKAVMETVKLELAEALQSSQMVLSNLSSAYQGELKETAGILFLNATAEGQDLDINPEIPIYIEIPSSKRKTRMMAYKGTRDENGNMDWYDPKNLESYIIPLKLELFNFYPPNFKLEVARSLPIGENQQISDALLDSLYYSLSNWNGKSSTMTVDPELKGKFEVGSHNHDSSNINFKQAQAKSGANFCGIDPQKIKAIRSEDYQDSFICSREFQKRLQSLYFCRSSEILDIYTNNLDKNLWELDSLAADAIKNDSLSQVFRGYQNEKLGSVQGDNIYVSILKDYYRKKLQSVLKQFREARDVVVYGKDSNGQAADDSSYSRFLIFQKKKKVSLSERYGFTWTDQGWLNVARSCPIDSCVSQKMELLVENGNSFDRIDCYFINTSKRSIYPMKSSDSKSFNLGSPENQELLIAPENSAIMLCLAVKNKQYFFGLNYVLTGHSRSIKMEPKPISPNNLAIKIRDLNYYTWESNSDFELLSALRQNRNAQPKLQWNQNLNRLRETAFPGCRDN
ncbi:hypothetical protein [Croceimicrobium sp.]|uniref:hypothetical protein n=1 Tax=Croceimicrobium sp. TaxID=2828340 RepID=UPI003BA9C289